MNESVHRTESGFPAVQKALLLQLSVSAGLCLVMAATGLLIEMSIGVAGAVLIAAICGLASLVALLPFVLLTRVDQVFAAAVGSMMLRTALSVGAFVLLVSAFGWEQNPTAGCFLLCYLVLLISEAGATVSVVSQRNVSISQQTEHVA